MSLHIDRTKTKEYIQDKLETVAEKLMTVDSRTTPILLGLETTGTQDAYICFHKQVSRGQVAGTLLGGISGGTTSLKHNTSWLEGLKASPVALNSLRITGTVGSYIVLACDSVEMLERSAVHCNITKQLKDTAKDSLEYTVLKEMQSRMEKLIASSVCAVIMDTFEAAISTGAPIMGLPVHIVGFAVAIARIYGEHVIDKKTRIKLEKTVKAFEESRQDLLKDVEGLKQNYKTAQANYQAAKIAKEQTAKELEKANSAYRNPLQAGGSLENQQAAQKADVLAEDKLKSAEKALKRLEKDHSDLEAYELANQLIQELHPLLIKKTRLEKHMESFHDLHTQTYGSRFLDDTGQKKPIFNHKKYLDHLDKQLQPLKAELNKFSDELHDTQLMLINMDLPGARNVNLEHRDFLCDQVSRLQREISNLRSDIDKIQRESKVFEQYQKSSKSLLRVNKKIEDQNRKKLEEQAKLERSKPPTPVLPSISEEDFSEEDNQMIIHYTPTFNIYNM